MASPLLLTSDALMRQGREREAAALVDAAFRRGDPDAWFVVATWRVWGNFGVRDFAAAHRLLREASEQGHVDATLMLSTLVGNGTGVAADWRAGLALLRKIADDPRAAKQLALIDGMALDEEGGPASLPPLTTVRSEPWVVRADKLLTEAECSYVVVAAAPRLEPSSIVDRSGARVPHPVRTSDGASFGPVHEDLVIRAINRRIAAVTQTEAAHGEPLHILRYRPGEQYRPHHDAIPGEANQRRLTVLTYLNDRYQGGETGFTKTKLKLRGGTGDAVIFRNLDAAGRPDPLAEHAGLPVTSGMKWLATRWIRGAPYHPWATGG